MPSSGRLTGIGVVLALTLSAAPTWAAERSAGVKELEVDAARLQRNAEEIRRNFTERSGLIGVTEARERYEDALYLYLVEDYENAATAFYILVQSRALGNEDLARDSEWYLAECLFELGNYRTSEEAYRAIVDRGAQHPYFQDAIRRLLEIYALLGDVERFDRFYQDFIVTGRVPATELVNYTLAKSFYRRGEFNRSKATFESLPAASPYYSRARYFLGVLMIREKNYGQAIKEYQLIQGLTPASPEEQQVQELAPLAIARLHYETGNFEEANVWYGKISETSPYYADKLYESAWAYVKRANTATDAKAARALWEDALDGVEIFLLAFPEHRYTASLKILQGHLHMKLQAYEEARVAYERVVDEYTPLIQRLDAVERPDQLRRLLEGASGGEAAVSERLPPFAMGALLSDESVARAAAAWRSVEDQRETLMESERIVKGLEIALSGGGDVLGTFTVARQELASIDGAAFYMRDRLIEAEANWLRSRIPAQQRGELAQIQRDRAAASSMLSALEAVSERSSAELEAREAQVREVQLRAFRVAELAQEAKAEAASTIDAVGQSKLSIEEANRVRGELVAQQRELEGVLQEIDSLQGDGVWRRLLRSVDAGTPAADESVRDAALRRYEELRRRLQSYRTQVSDGDASDYYAQLDRLWAAVDALGKSVSETGRVLGSAEAREVAAVRTRLARESQRVVELRRDLERGSADAEAIAMRAVRTGIRKLGDDFRDDVLEADKGIVDVYWLRKSATSEQMTELGEEQSRLLRELDQQFRIVRENLER